MKPPALRPRARFCLAALLSIVAALAGASLACAHAAAEKGHPAAQHGRAASARIVPTFKVSVIGLTVPGHRGEERVTRLRMTGLEGGEQITWNCQGCRGAKLGPLRGGGGVRHFSPRHMLVTASSRLILFVTANERLGRFKIYTLRPRLRSHRLVQQGCLAVDEPIRVSCVGGVSNTVGPLGTILAPEPSCPTSCEAITRVTGFQVHAGAFNHISSIREPGYVTGWRLALGSPAPNQMAFFEGGYGGPAEAGLAILRPQPNLTYELVAQSPVVALQPYLGTTAQFALPQPLRVEPGEVVGITTPTWAPVLALGYASEASWRGSRPSRECVSANQQSSQSEVGSVVQYYCLYKTAILTYSAIFSPTP